jgi:hypothetical protein
MAAADVINRLNVLRGKGMASLYSWSCKRYYCNGIHHFGGIRYSIAENERLILLLLGLILCVSPGATRTDSCGTTCPRTISCSPRRATSTSSRAPSSLTARRRQVCMYPTNWGACHSQTNASQINMCQSDLGSIFCPCVVS